MRSFLRISLYALLLICGSTLISHADVTVTMHMTMGGKTFDKLGAAEKAKLDKMMDIVSYYSSGKIRSDSFMTTTIIDKNNKKMYMLNSTAKTYIELPYTKDFSNTLAIPSNLKDYKYNIKDTKQVLTLLGHKTHRYIMDMKNAGFTMKMDMYVAQDFPAADIKAYQGNSPINGIPLKIAMSMSSKNMPVTNTIIETKEIKTTPIDPKVFELPKDYTKTDMAGLFQQKSNLLVKGTIAPDFTVYTKDGSAVKLSDYAGKVVMIDFWSTWCGPCQKSLPHTQSLAKKYKQEGLIVLGVNVWDTKDAFMKWIPAHTNYSDISFLIDTSAQPKDVASALYKVNGIPTVYIIGKDGKVAGSTVGYDEADTSIEKCIKSALSQ